MWYFPQKLATGFCLILLLLYTYRFCYSKHHCNCNHYTKTNIISMSSETTCHKPQINQYNIFNTDGWIHKEKVQVLVWRNYFWFHEKNKKYLFVNTIHCQFTLITRSKLLRINHSLVALRIPSSAQGFILLSLVHSTMVLSCWKICLILMGHARGRCQGDLNLQHNGHMSRIAWLTTCKYWQQLTLCPVYLAYLFCYW